MTTGTPAMTDLLKLAASLEACAEDAKRPEPVLGYTDIFRNVSPQIISLANGLLLIASELRAHAAMKEDK